jgi:hypothetical protein
MRNWLLDEKMDDMIMERNMAVADQDIALLNELRPALTPPTLTKEIFVPADLIIGAYRSSLDEFTEKGFKIDTQKVKETQHQTAYAIPSPARRTEKNWVLDSVPLVKE